MAGGVRNEGDAARADQIEFLAKELGVGDKISVERNITVERMDELFCTAEAAIHTMRDEHFGITCVEFKASGVITVAHDSAGPGQDILIPYKNQPTGYLARDTDEFASHLVTIFNLDEAEKKQLRENGRQSCHVFTSENFGRQFGEAVNSLFL